jgi:hypothetical protein
MFGARVVALRSDRACAVAAVMSRGSLQRALVVRHTRGANRHTGRSERVRIDSCRGTVAVSDRDAASRVWEVVRRVYGLRGLDLDRRPVGRSADAVVRFAPLQRAARQVAAMQGLTADLDGRGPRGRERSAGDDHLFSNALLGPVACLGDKGALRRSLPGASAIASSLLSTRRALGIAPCVAVGHPCGALLPDRLGPGGLREPVCRGRVPGVMSRIRRQRT